MNRTTIEDHPLSSSPKDYNESQELGLPFQGYDNLSFDNVMPVSISVDHLSIHLNGSSLLKKIGSTKKKQQQDTESSIKSSLLDDISFQIPPGKLFAIMGGSGSGKTTLLNTLAKRSSINNSKLCQSGTILYNGSSNLNSINHAYVIQQDILIPNLTCYETLKYAATLRLSSKVSEAKQEELIDSIINELGLKDCKHTMVGNHLHKGLSGGEKRRLSIAIQLLSNPSLLFLDEPTTGLDAHSAILLVHTLKNLAKKGRNIVLSIHQPPSDVFFLFDYLCILSRGSPVYCHRTDAALDYFGKMGYKVEANVNPADYLIDVTSVDNRDLQSETRTLQNLEMLKENWRNFEQNLEIYQDNNNEKTIDKTNAIENSGNLYNSSEILKHSRANIWREIITLTKRDLVLTSRDPLTSLALWGEAAFVGVILGWVFYRPDNSLTGIRSLTGCIYNVNGLQGYLMLIFETYRLCYTDIRVYDRERAENSVTVPGFLISRRLSRFISQDVAVPTIFTIFTYFMIGFKSTAKEFFIYWAINLLNHQIAMAYAVFAVSLSRDYTIAALLGNINFTFQTYCCGFFVNLTTMPVYVRWIKYLCYVWYGYGVTVSSQFTGFFGDCPYNDDPSDPRCVTYTGANIIENLGFWENWITLPLCVMFAFIWIFHGLAAVVLMTRRVDVAIAKQSKKSKPMTRNDEVEVEVTTDSKSISSFKENKPALDGIDIYLNNISLKVKVFDISFQGIFKRVISGDFKFLKRRKKFSSNLDPQAKEILHHVHATFQRHKINAIMGPSGSGKTTLLNVISGKLKSNFVTEYTQEGEILFNEYPVTSDLLAGICSYVLQDDDSLLPSLTVRQTLAFAAKLRLAKVLTKKEIDARVTDVIMKLGLKECQDNLIGSELVKGISGGEKRRVSIGIQLLNDPQVIFLDEPTSGLDSFTALSILTILENLATVEKRTVVLTIHQPRYSIFERFGQILLLSKGGNVVFNGPPSSMASYFEKLGHICPKLTNFADFVLDLVSVNTQAPELEKSTKARVNSLVNSWNGGKPPQFNDKSIKNIDDSEAVFGKYRKVPASFRVAFPLVFGRQFSNVTIGESIAKVLQSAGTGILSALFYAPLKHDYVAVVNIIGLTQQVSALYFVGMLNNVALYPIERDFFYEEHADKVYGITPFFVSYSIIETGLELIASVVFAVLTVFAIGLPRTCSVFFSFVYVGWMFISCGESLGIFFNTIFRHTGFAINIISIFVSISVIISGLIALQLPPFFKGINWVNPMHYGVMAISNIVFQNEDKFTCTADSGASGNGDGCIFNNGQDVIDTYGLGVDYKLYFGLLAVMAVCYRAIAFIVLWMRVNNYKSGVVRKCIGAIVG
ncbi:hypothetical protein DASC09_010450 [Saccharomycopsis crataegensis]|uniref:ABC transporter domain-containing protein n=1 Tax=Saccharomycopsis crataegensis TaxID=43959 RepID=A0AAV5QGZ2_9ASCO|nr:hypothetical protein DASC09_010450 [Saccharomycopsis crataegensis]